MHPKSNEMTALITSKACFNCAKARRKCGRQQPECQRCAARSLCCDYPPSKPSSFVLLQSDELIVQNKETWPEFTILQYGQHPLLDSCMSFVDDKPPSWWFASPGTWTIDSAPPEITSITSRLSSILFDRVQGSVVRWLAQWVAQGSNPFIHHQLYRDHMPAAMQDAYLVLCSYFQKTPTNSSIIQNIIAEKATRLVEQGLPSGSPSDPLEHLACIQALLIYQCISLFDGNLRLRCLAERHIGVLETWSAHHMRDVSAYLSMNTQSTTCDSIASSEVLWYSWIFAETVRRTWLVTGGVQGIYKFITQPDIPACIMGGTIFTTRSGFWEATTADVWEKQCMEKYAGLVRLTEVPKMLHMVPKEEICEFARLIFECTYGMDQTKQWGL